MTVYFVALVPTGLWRPLPTSDGHRWAREYEWALPSHEFASLEAARAGAAAWVAESLSVASLMPLKIRVGHSSGVRVRGPSVFYVDAEAAVVVREDIFARTNAVSLEWAPAPTAHAMPFDPSKGFTALAGTLEELGCGE